MLTPTDKNTTLAAQIEALAPCPNPWCTSRSAPILIRSRMASNGWHVACACGIRSWSRPSEAEAVETWNTRPAIVTALRQAEAAPVMRTWANTTDDQRERMTLLADVELHLQSTRVFLTSRERMHPCGVEIHDELLTKVSTAIEAIGSERVS